MFWIHRLGYISAHFLYKYSCRFPNFCPVNYWRKMWHLSCMVTYELCLADLYYVEVFVLNAFLISTLSFSYFTIYKMREMWFFFFTIEYAWLSEIYLINDRLNWILRTQAVNFSKEISGNALSSILQINVMIWCNCEIYCVIPK